VTLQRYVPLPLEIQGDSAHFNTKEMTKKLYIDKEIPENVQDEIVLLYSLGVEIEELEYLIQVKFRESLKFS